MGESDLAVGNCFLLEADIQVLNEASGFLFDASRYFIELYSCQINSRTLS